MNKEEAQIQALKEQHQNHHGWGIAIVFTQDGENWVTAWHPESRYLETSVQGCYEAKEIWICSKYGEDWTCYKAPAKPVDYVKETGATGDLAAVMQTVQAMRFEDSLEKLSQTELADVLKQMLDDYDKENK